MAEVGSTSLQDERFLLLGTLGRGGMGTVYRAFDRAAERIVALKVPYGSHGPGGPAHPFSMEFETWAGLRHENIVRAYELQLARHGPLETGRPYLVLEHVRGGPAHRVLHPGRVEAPILETLAHEVLRALAHVHAAGFVHRDLKPANVLVEPSGRSRWRVKLTDFGLAVPVGASRVLGTFSGSLPYVSPEALLGLPVDGRTDLYGLGILLYQMATGETPARGQGPEGILRWHLAGPPVDPSRKRPGLPDRLTSFIRRLAERRREDRPDSAEHALRLLRSDAEPASGAIRPEMALAPADRVKIRLAFDAVRLGGRRALRLASMGSSASVTARQVEVWAQVRGIRYHALRERDQRTLDGLARFVLRLLLDRPPEANAYIRRYRLDDILPLAVVGGQPLLDASRNPGVSAVGRAELEARARRLFRFLTASAEQHALVLYVERARRPEPIVQHVVRWLALWAETSERSRTGGGLLLLLDGEKVEAPTLGTSDSGHVTGDDVGTSSGMASAIRF